MTPAARLHAAIELLAMIEAGHGAADRIVAGYFRGRRYAGAKDRRAIAERLYAILRHRGELAWRLANAGAPVDPRRLALAGLVVVDRLALDEIDRLCDGGRFAPTPLEGEERSWLAGLDDAATPPDWARGNYPDWLDDAVKQRFGADWPSELAAMATRAPLDLRVNALKTERDVALAALRADAIAADPCPWSPLGIRLASRVRITDHRLYREGHVEVQDEGSQAVALMAAAGPGMQVIDLCAGAGGKSLVLAGQMANTGQIYACDVDRRRLAELASRMQRAGARNIQTHVLDKPDDPWLDQYAGRADLVLVDAPCSGTGTWRRNPDLIWRLTAADLDRYRRHQQSLLARAAGLVRPGGRLVYVTCSFVAAENEAQIDQFLAANGEFSALPVERFWHENLSGACPSKGPYIMLTPARQATDAFFAAILKRRVP